MGLSHVILIVIIIVLMALVVRFLKGLVRGFILLCLVGVFFFGWGKVEVLEQGQRFITSLTQIAGISADFVKERVSINGFNVEVKVDDELTVSTADAKIIGRENLREGDELRIEVKGRVYGIPNTNPVYKVLYNMVQYGLIK